MPERLQCLAQSSALIYVYEMLLDLHLLWEEVVCNLVLFVSKA